MSAPLMTAQVGDPVAMQWAQVGEPSTPQWVQVGEPIQTMLTPEGTRVWIGTGAPTLVPGASYGDHYIDEATGILYVLG